jgi:hypothetical protein
MAEALNAEDVARLPLRKEQPDITLALQRMSDELRSVCPANVLIAFRFDTKLHVDIDVRTLEDVALVEHILPVALGGTLSNVRRGKAALSFFHRITAEVDA